MANFPALRMRRLRQHDALRAALAETTLETRHLIWPIFVTEGEGLREEISGFSHVFRWSVDRLDDPLSEAMSVGVRAFMLFGLPTWKDASGTSASAAEQPVQKALAYMRNRYPEALAISDVCLCQYTDHGHCGLLTSSGDIDNDATLERLSEVALSHARAGAHMVAPSDMMDGRVGHLRHTLDAAGFTDVSIMSYAAKMQSAFYGPFREAAQSAPSFGDRRTYQMQPGNAREAVREALLDENEGADILMVKPALTCLDILSRLRSATMLPLATYFVSGEYMMLHSAIERGLLDERKAVLEAHIACRRAGADLIVSYDAVRLGQWLREG